MWHCLVSSVINDVKAKVNAFQSELEHIENNQTFTSAPLLLKTKMQLATLNNKATSETLKINLHELAAYAANVKNTMEYTLTFMKLFSTQGKRKRIW